MQPRLALNSLCSKTVNVIWTPDLSALVYKCDRAISVYHYTRSMWCWMEVKHRHLYVLYKAFSQILDHTPVLYTQTYLLSHTQGAVFGV